MNKQVHDLMVAGQGHALRVMRYGLLTRAVSLVKSLTKSA